MSHIDQSAVRRESGWRKAVHLLDKLLVGLFNGAVVLCLAAIVSTVAAGVWTRYVLNDSLTWTEAGGRWLFLYLIFIGAALAHRNGRHLAVDIVAPHLPDRARAVQRFCVDTVVAIALAALVFYGIGLANVVQGVEAMVELPVWLKVAVIPVCATAATFFQVSRAVEEGQSGFSAFGPVATGVALVFAADAFGANALSLGISSSLILGVVFAVTLLAGVPVAFSLLLASIFSALFGDALPPRAMVQGIVTGSGSFLLLAIPLFIFASAVMSEGGLAARLLDFAQSLVGRARGGLAQVNVLMSFLFGGVSGSAGSDVALNSKLVVPEMLRHGYSKEFSCAITAASSLLTNIVPPSIAMIIFAEITGASVIGLFIGGIGAASILAALLMTMVWLISVKRGYGSNDEPTSVARIARGFVRAIPVLSLAMLIVVGIRLGVFTPTEAGGTAAIYALVLAVVVYRTLGATDLWNTMIRAATDAATIGLLIAVARPFTTILYSEQVPQMLVSSVLDGTAAPWLILLSVVAIGLIMGTVLDLTVSVLILTPLVWPLLLHVGLDPIHAGVVIVVTLLLGAITPPVGIIVFISATMTDASVTGVFKEIVPFFVMMVLGLLAMVFVPEIVLGLVYLLG